MQGLEHEFLWVEKYRPQKIDDAILPERLKSVFKNMLANQEVTNVTLAGSAGVGKTTAAIALCNELNCDVLVINASLRGNIDTIRTDITNFASTVSFRRRTKVVVLDEADGLTELAQRSLRAFMEEFSANCRFILTCNFENRIIEPLKSRCPIVNFTLTKEEKIETLKGVQRRCAEILANEGVLFEKEDLVQVIIKHFPDFRKILNQLQLAVQNGELNVRGVSAASERAMVELVAFLKAKDFGKMRKWVADNIDNEFSAITRNLYDKASTYFVVQSIPQVIMTLADYDYRNAFVADREVNLVAMLTDIMCNAEFK